MGAAAVAAVVSVGTTAYAQNRADARAEDVEEAQEERAAEQKRIRSSQAARSRRKQVQKALVARSQVENAAASQGVSGSSAVIQGAAGTSAQAASNISGINTQVAGQASLEAANQKIVNKQSKGPGLGEQLAGQVGNISTGVVGKLAENYDWENLFKD